MYSIYNYWKILLPTKEFLNTTKGIDELSCCILSIEDIYYIALTYFKSFMLSFTTISALIFVGLFGYKIKNNYKIN